MDGGCARSSTRQQSDDDGSPSYRSRMQRWLRGQAPTAISLHSTSRRARLKYRPVTRMREDNE
eukprot:3840287-Pleurochrysis_carterae.AAC.2